MRIPFGPYLERKEAAVLNHRYYLTGRECPNGHFERRYTSNNMCMACNRERSQRIRDDYGTTPTAKLSYRRIFYSARDRAKTRGVEFSVSKDFWNALIERGGDRCSLTSIPFVFGRFERNGRTYSRNPYGPSIDRIDTRFGYVEGNIRIICLGINLALNEWGDQIFDHLIENYWKSKHGS